MKGRKEKKHANAGRLEELDKLRQASREAELEAIRRLLALPMEKRTHFLRRRLPGGGSCL